MNSTAGNTVKRSIMAIGSHADDLEVHIGGTLLKYHAMGYEIVYVMSTNNMSGRVQEIQEDGSVKAWIEPPIAMMQRRKRECDDAAKILGTTPIHLDHPQRHYSTGNGNEQLELRYGGMLPEGVQKDVPTILTAGEDAESIEKLASLILEKNPECIITHGIAQSNIEHFATSLLVTNSFWRTVEQGFEGGLLHWREAHTLHGEFNCRWETFVDYSPWLDRKMEFLGQHRCQMPKAHEPDFGHRLLGTWYGKACGCTAAEVFTWVRRPIRRDSTGPVCGELTLELIQNSH